MSAQGSKALPLATDLARKVATLYAPFGLWRRFYAGFRVALSRFDLVEHHLPRDGHVLDLGCGYGVASNYLALASSGRHVTGIDWDARRIAVAKATIGDRTNAHFVQADLLDAELPPADVVLMTDFLHHLEPDDQQRLLKRLAAVLKPGARLLIHEVNTEPRWKYWCSFASDMVLYAFEGGHFRSPRDWVSLLTSLGFKSVEVVPGDRGSIFARVSYLAEK